MWAIIWNIRERRRQMRMASERAALSESEFISEMVADGVRAETARFVWSEAVSFYIDPLKPDPNDCWESTMRIDPEDLEDVTAKFWKKHGWLEPDPKEPVILPSDPSLIEYAHWLDRQRHLQE